MFSMNKKSDFNNNFIPLKSELKYLSVKIPHLSKKFHVHYSLPDTISHLIERIQILINDRPLNFGILIKTKSKTRRFLKEDANLIDFINGENKFLYCKKHRIISKAIRKLKTDELSMAKKIFTEYLINNNVIKLLPMLQNGFDPNYLLDGESPLHMAVSLENSIVLISVLLSHGAHTDYRNIENCSVLHKAIKMSRSEIVKVLLEFGSSPDLIDNSNLTPLNYSILHNIDSECFKQLLKFNAKLNMSNEEGLFEIHQACYYNKLEHLKELLKLTQNINLQTNPEENTPLHYAIFGNSLNCIKYLLENGVNVDIKNIHGYSPLDIIKTQFPDLLYLFERKDCATDEPKEKMTNLQMNEEILKLSNEPSILHDQVISSIMVSNIIEGTKNEKYNSPINHDESSKNSTTQISVFESSDSLSKENMDISRYFGVQTKVIEFSRSKDSFGFSIETDIDGPNISLSYEKPSFHRICKWKVFSTTISLFSKPFLLEVNSTPVTRMNHEDIVTLIKFSPNPIKLLIVDPLAMKLSTNNSPIVKNSNKMSESSLVYINKIRNINDFTNKFNCLSGSSKINELYQGSGFKLMKGLYQNCQTTSSLRINLDRSMESPNSLKSNILFPKKSLDSVNSVGLGTYYIPYRDDKAHQLSNNFCNGEILPNFQTRFNSERYIDNLIKHNSPISNLDYDISSNCQSLPRLHRSGITIQLHKSEFHSSEIYVPFELS